MGNDPQRRPISLGWRVLPLPGKDAGGPIDRQCRGLRCLRGYLLPRHRRLAYGWKHALAHVVAALRGQAPVIGEREVLKSQIRLARDVDVSAIRQIVRDAYSPYVTRIAENPRP
jgi:hypothetical protein